MSRTGRWLLGLGFIASVAAAPIVAAAQDGEPGKWRRLSPDSFVSSADEPQRGGGRTGGSSGGSGQAVPRSGGGGGSSSGGSSGGGGGSSAPRAGSGSSGGGSASGRGAAPAGRSATAGRSGAVAGDGGSYAVPAETTRPRGDRWATGAAVPRRYPPPGSGGGWWDGGYWYPSYPWGYGAFGLSWMFYDPYWWGGYGYGYPVAAYQAPAYSYGQIGFLKIKVEPNDADVIVDGYYAGTVDSFDGVFQRLKLDVGPHRIEIRKPGFETLTVEVRLQAEETTTIRGELKPAP